MFFPSIFILTIISGILLIYLKYQKKQFGKKLHSIKWLKKERKKVIWTLSAPEYCILAPAREEVIFRAPLIIIFSEISSNAWYGIFISSIIFSLMHWAGEKVSLSDIISSKTDNTKIAKLFFLKRNRKKIFLRKIIHVLCTFPLGILAGYYGIKHQSIWVAFAIHSIWNTNVILLDLVTSSHKKINSMAP